MIFPAPVEEEQLAPIQGRMPDSKEEYWVAKALYRYQIPFHYQWEIYGGTTRRGGLVVDFVVWNPMMTPLLVYGNYWHKNELDGGDKTRIIAIAQYFNIGAENIPILWAGNSTTEEDVFNFVRREIAR